MMGLTPPCQLRKETLKIRPPILGFPPLLVKNSHPHHFLKISSPFCGGEGCVCGGRRVGGGGGVGVDNAITLILKGSMTF